MTIDSYFKLAYKMHSYSYLQSLSLVILRRLKVVDSTYHTASFIDFRFIIKISGSAAHFSAMQTLYMRV